MATKLELLGQNNQKLIEAYTNDQFSDFVRKLQENGHQLDISDFTKTTTNSHGRELETGQLIADYSKAERVFVPELWVDNLETAIQLHNRYKDTYSFGRIDIDRFSADVKALEKSGTKSQSAKDSAIDRAIIQANIDNNKTEEIRTALANTLSWMEGGDDRKGDKPTAAHKDAAAYAIQNPAVLATVARGLAEGNKPLDYASKTIVEEHIKALAKTTTTAAVVRPAYKLDLDDTKKRILGLNYNDFFSDLLAAARDNTIPQLRKKLQDNGYDFGKAEFLQRAYDQFPNLICYNDNPKYPPLARIDTILPALDENGQRFTIDEWKTEFSVYRGRYNFVSFAAHLGVLDKLFKPELWANHVDEMEQVWQLVPSRSRDQINFQALRDEAQALSSPEFEVTSSLSKADLFVPNDRGLAPLDDVRTWRKFDAVTAALDANGGALSKVDLLQKNSKGRAYIQIAASAGVFDKVVEYLGKRGESVTLAEVKEHGLEAQYTTPKAKLSLIDKEKPDAAVQLPGSDSLLQLAVLENDLELTKRVVASLKEVHKEKPQELLDALTRGGSNDYSPADTARRANSKEVEQYLTGEVAEARVRIGKPSDFVEAADTGNLALVQKYIELKAVDLDVTHYDNKWTALMSAVKNNHEPVVDALLAAGANPDARSVRSQNISALYICASRNREALAPKIITALKEKYKDDPVSLFKALTYKSTGTDRSIYQEAKREGHNGIATLIDAEVAALIPTVATWDEKTLQDTDARRALKEHGKIRALTETIDTRPHKRIAIVGAGFSGTVTAIHLLNNAREPLEVMLIEKSDKRRSGGIAYSAETASEELLTNIPISRMSAFDDRPNDLLEWLGRADRKDWPERYQRTRFEANQSVPRVLYQQYLETRLQEAIDRNETSLIKKLNGEVVDVIDTPEKATVVFKDGTAYDANQAILATGYTTPKEARFTAKIKETDRYIADQYSADGQELRKAIGKDDTVLVVGSGLSAYDAIVSLKQQGHEGKIIVTSRGGHTHPPYPNRGIEDAFRIDRPRFMDAATVPELISGLRKDFWERTALEGHSTERVIEAYQRYLPELIKKFPSDTVRQLLRDHSSLIATLRVGVSSEIARIVEDAKISGQVQILPANLHEMQPTENGVKVRYTPSGSSHDETMDVGHVISCLGRDTVKDDLWRNLTARGQTQSHFTGHGIQVGAQGQVVDSLNKESSTVIAVGPMRGGDSLERNGLIGPPAFAVPGIRRQMQAAAELALQRLSKQTEVVHTPVEAKTESVADKVVMRDRTGRMHCEIGFGADSKPNEMKVFVGGGQGTLTEVHTRGEDDGTIKVTRYHDGEAQSPVTKRVGEPGFMSWDDVLASQQQVGAGRAANG